ncbi:glycosyltransferase [Proteiniclasticum ruminis]|uniref:glycosyltransferase n=1 Tax=Proteiniclasticum ruminis TaxID=398199 RepID=UPI0028A96CE8|nr:glycosyltransferase [Proteiniclasticum ruminis]
MKAYIISTFFVFQHRVALIESTLRKSGYDTTVLHSDFHHETKDNVEQSIILFQNYKLLPTLKYKKNISLFRILSHVMVSLKFYKTVKKESPELVYIVVPPNIILHLISKLKRKKNFILITDIMDMWPESFPIQRFKNNFFFKFWRRLRDENLKSADTIILECDYYRSIIGEQLELKMNTLHMPIREGFYKENRLDSVDEVNIVYIGSINNIIDIDLILEILTKISLLKPVKFNIIGDGETKKLLLNNLSETEIIVNDYGKVYDSRTIFDIVSKCHFALNIMKESVSVGLTMKSLEYFRVGVPIINNIKGDTKSIIDSNKCGFNITKDTVDDFVSILDKMTVEDFNKMKDSSRNVYTQYLSDSIFTKNLSNLIDKLGDIND